MLEVDETDSPAPLLACGHRWTGAEAWEDMLVILKEEVDGQPAYSTGHWCCALICLNQIRRFC